MKISSALVSSALFAGLAFGAEVPGVGNFHSVDTHFYRGAQPTAQGFASLAKLGVKTVLDLAEAGSRSRAEQKMVTAAGMQYINLPLSGVHAPSAAQVSRALAILNDTSTVPVFVHCRRGADRTGTVAACYRISHDHWDNQKALQEAKSFGMSWLEQGMQSYIERYTVPGAAAAPQSVATAAAQVSAGADSAR